VVNATPRPLYPRKESRDPFLEAGRAPEPLDGTCRRKYPLSRPRFEHRTTQALASNYKDDDLRVPQFKYVPCWKNKQTKKKLVQIEISKNFSFSFQMLCQCSLLLLLFLESTTSAYTSEVSPGICSYHPNLRSSCYSTPQYKIFRDFVFQQTERPCKFRPGLESERACYCVIRSLFNH
jgi:hypothetical protein